MPGMIKHKFLLLVTVIIMSVIQNGFAAEQQGQRLVSPILLEKADLKILWENVLPTRRGENLERLEVLGDHVYAISNKNYMLCLNRKNGKRVFGRVVAPSGVKVADMSLYNDKIISVVGSKLFEIDPNTGTDSNILNVDFGIICPAVRNSSYYYLSGSDKRLHTLQVEDGVEVFNVAAENDSIITTVLAGETFVVFGTEKGNIVSITPDLPKRLWQFDASAAITGKIVRDGVSLFFASGDMNVYRLDIVGTPEKRRLVWKYQTDGILNTTPRVTRGIVYQAVYGKGLTAINKNNGTLLWSVSGGIDFLAEADDNAYVITKDQTLVIMDNIEKKRLSSINVTGVTRYAANLTDSKIYIADKSGKIACIQPLE